LGVLNGWARDIFVAVFAAFRCQKLIFQAAVRNGIGFADDAV
jgi:hypothetical protein